MAIKNLKFGQTKAENLQNAEDNFVDLYGEISDTNDALAGKAPINHTHPADANKLNIKPDGTNLLISATDNKIQTCYLPSSVLGQVEYKGTWNPSTQTAVADSTYTPRKGDYWIAVAAGNKNPKGGGGTSNDTYYDTGDWAVYNGTSWDKVDNTDSVKLVNGQSGEIETYKGTYVAGTSTTQTVTYYKGDIVLYLNNLYICILKHNAISTDFPTNTSKWKIFGKTYSAATTSADGLLAATDKTKYDSAYTNSHTHSNKSTLDSYNQSNSDLTKAVTASQRWKPLRGYIKNSSFHTATISGTSYKIYELSMAGLSYVSNNNFAFLGAYKIVTISGITTSSQTGAVRALAPVDVMVCKTLSQQLSSDPTLPTATTVPMSNLDTQALIENTTVGEVIMIAVDASFADDLLIEYMIFI